MTGLIQQLLAFPPSCIYAWVDEPNKGMYICFTEFRGLFRLYENLLWLKAGIHNYKDLQDAYNRGSLEIKILKDYNGKPPHEAVIRAEMMDILRKSGYNDMRRDGPPSNYRLKQRIFQRNTERPFVCVYCRSSTANEMVLGIFDSVHEAEDWIAATYPNGERDMVGIIPRFALNERTREYHEAYGYKLQRKKLY